MSNFRILKGEGSEQRLKSDMDEKNVEMVIPILYSCYKNEDDFKPFIEDRDEKLLFNFWVHENYPVPAENPIVSLTNIEYDLSRRDFTINAMAENKNGEIIDPFGGQADLNKKVFKQNRIKIHLSISLYISF